MGCGSSKSKTVAAEETKTADVIIKPEVTNDGGGAVITTPSSKDKVKKSASFGGYLEQEFEVQSNYGSLDLLEGRWKQVQAADETDNDQVPPTGSTTEDVIKVSTEEVDHGEGSGEVKGLKETIITIDGPSVHLLLDPEEYGRLTMEEDSKKNDDGIVYYNIIFTVEGEPCKGIYLQYSLQGDHDIIQWEDGEKWSKLYDGTDNMVSVDIENKSGREIGRISIHGQSALGRSISQSFCGDHIPILGSSGVQQVSTTTGDSPTAVTMKAKKMSRSGTLRMSRTSLGKSLTSRKSFAEIGLNNPQDILEGDVQYKQPGLSSKEKYKASMSQIDGEIIYEAPKPLDWDHHERELIKIEAEIINPPHRADSNHTKNNPDSKIPDDTIPDDTNGGIGEDTT